MIFVASSHRVAYTKATAVAIAVGAPVIDYRSSAYNCHHTAGELARDLEVAGVSAIDSPVSRRSSPCSCHRIGVEAVEGTQRMHWVSALILSSVVGHHCVS